MHKQELADAERERKRTYMREYMRAYRAMIKARKAQIERLAAERQKDLT